MKELRGALNDMKGLLGKDHSEKEWKFSVCRVLCAMAEEIAHPPVQVQNNSIHIDELLARFTKMGPNRIFTDLYGVKGDTGKVCLNRQMDENDPSSVGKPRMLSCPCPNCSPYSLRVNSSPEPDDDKLRARMGSEKWA